MTLLLFLTCARKVHNPCNFLCTNSRCFKLTLKKRGALLMSSSPSRVSYLRFLRPLASPRLFSHPGFTFPIFCPLPNAFFSPPLHLFHPSFLFPRALFHLIFARVFRRPYLNSSARIFSSDHLFPIFARPQAAFITHVPSTQTSSYQCFSSLLEGLFKTPLFAQRELRVDINSSIVSVLFQ